MEQAELLRLIGAAPSIEALASDFAEGFRHVHKFFARNWIVNAEVYQLTRINDALIKMSGPPNEGLWTLEALANSQEWANVRRLADDFVRIYDANASAHPRPFPWYPGYGPD